MRQTSEQSPGRFWCPTSAWRARPHVQSGSSQWPEAADGEPETAKACHCPQQDSCFPSLVSESGLGPSSDLEVLEATKKCFS